MQGTARHVFVLLMLQTLLVRGGARPTAAQAGPVGTFDPTLLAPMLQVQINQIEGLVPTPTITDPTDAAALTRATADAENVELVGHIGGRTETVFVQGNYGYIGVGPRLAILDISNPASLTVVGQTPPLPDIVQGACISGGYAYVADGRGGLRVIDKSDPAVPIEIGFYDTPAYAHGVTVVGGYAYVADNNGLRVVDVSNPVVPVGVGSYDTPEPARGVAVSGTHAYVADGSFVGGLRVVDVSNPATPTEVAYYDLPGTATDVVVTEGYAYVANYGEGLRVMDVSNPTAPMEVGFYRIEGAWGVAVAGSYAYVGDGWGGLRVVDVSDPAAPTEVSRWDTPGYAYDVAVAEGYAYIADGRGGLRVVSASDPVALVEVGSYETSADAHGVAVVAGIAYVVNRSGGLRVVDVSDPTAPAEVGFYDTPGAVQDVAVKGSTAYVADGSGGLRVADVTNPAAPAEVGFYDTPGLALGVAVEGSTAYVADGSGGLRMVDVSTPSDPAEVSFYDTPGDVRDVVVARDHAYITDRGVLDGGQYLGRGLRVVDVADPTAPSQVGFYDTRIAPLSVALVGDYAYVADDAGDLRVVDVSNPDAPREVGFYDTPGAAAYGVAVAGGYAYVAAAGGGLRVVDVSDPTAPVQVGLYYPPGSASGVTVAGGYVYVAASYGGLFILRYTPLTGHDAYEPDDTCAQASALATDGTAQQHTFHQHADEDWAHFTIVSGTTYVVQATRTGSGADLVLELYDACDGNLEGSDDTAFGTDARLVFTAPSSGTYYVRALNHDPATYGPDVTYELSVRTHTPWGVAIIVAGRSRADDYRQPIINATANLAYQTFLNAGFPADNILYLNADLTQPGVDDAPSWANVRDAIQDWARGRVGPGVPLWVYLADHGNVDRFHNDVGQVITAAELDLWLGNLEAMSGVDQVSVVIDACNSGSFIDTQRVEGFGQDEISGPGRVVVASTSYRWFAYAPRIVSGQPVPLMYFSDGFWHALGESQDVWNAFLAGRATVEAAGQLCGDYAYTCQRPWLDDNGDAWFDGADGDVARGRGLAVPFREVAPYIDWVEVGEVSDRHATIRAQVRDDGSVARVWARVFAPSFAPPESTDGDIPVIKVPEEDLTAAGDDVYQAEYAGFTENGVYQVVVYAVDDEENAGMPRWVFAGETAVYLPLVLR